MYFVLLVKLLGLTCLQEKFGRTPIVLWLLCSLRVVTFLERDILICFKTS